MNRNSADVSRYKQEDEKAITQYRNDSARPKFPVLARIAGHAFDCVTEYAEVARIFGVQTK